MSDNGPDPYDRSEREIYKDFFTQYNYDQRYENMGSGTSYLFQGLGWAQTSNVYQQGTKFYLLKVVFITL